jgi:hypothetical protein
MKQLFFIGLILLSFSSFAQKSFSIRAGAAYSGIKDVTIDLPDGLGYYVGVGFKDQITPHLWMTPDIYFLNQRTTGDIDLSVRSINALIGLTIYPAQKGFYFIFGPEVGHSVGYALDGEKVEADQDVRFSYVGGAGYDIIEKVSIESRFVGNVDHQQNGYKYNIQLGIKYTF